MSKSSLGNSCSRQIAVTFDQVKFKQVYFEQVTIQGNVTWRASERRAGFGFV
jgi:hypothetical protein